MGGVEAPGAVAVVIAGGVAAGVGKPGTGSFVPAWGGAGAAGAGAGVPAAGAGVPGLAGAAGWAGARPVLPGGGALGFGGGAAGGLRFFSGHKAHAPQVSRPRRSPDRVGTPHPTTAC